MGIAIILSIVFGRAPYTPPPVRPTPAVVHRDVKPHNLAPPTPTCEELEEADDDSTDDCED